MKVVLESNIQHLAKIPEFREKVKRAFENKQGETFRVYWKPYGWIRFILTRHGHYLGYCESEGTQTVLESYMHGT